MTRTPPVSGAGPWAAGDGRRPVRLPGLAGSPVRRAGLPSYGTFVRTVGRGVAVGQPAAGRPAPDGSSTQVFGWVGALGSIVAGTLILWQLLLAGGTGGDVWLGQPWEPPAVPANAVSTTSPLPSAAPPTGTPGSGSDADGSDAGGVTSSPGPGSGAAESGSSPGPSPSSGSDHGSGSSSPTSDDSGRDGDSSGPGSPGSPGSGSGGSSSDSSGPGGGSPAGDSSGSSDDNSGSGGGGGSGGSG